MLLMRSTKDLQFSKQVVFVSKNYSEMMSVRVHNMAPSAILSHIVLSIGLIDWFCVTPTLQPCAPVKSCRFALFVSERAAQTVRHC